MKPFPPEQLATLLKTISQHPMLKPVERSALEHTITVLEEYSEIKPEYDADVKRLNDQITELNKRLKNHSDLYIKFEAIAQYLFTKLENDETLETSLYNEVDGYEWTITDPDMRAIP